AIRRGGGRGGSPGSPRWYFARLRRGAPGPLPTDDRMTGKLIDRLVAAGVFVYARVVYLLTMAETAPFWDFGEFSASVKELSVMHPPGAPFYILLGRFFTF